MATGKYSEELPCGPINILELRAEGGGTTVRGIVQKGKWSFWREGTYMDFDKDDNEIWRQSKSNPVGSISDAIPSEWYFLVPADPHPAFVPQLREWYASAYEVLTDGEKDKHDKRWAQRWHRILKTDM